MKWWFLWAISSNHNVVMRSPLFSTMYNMSKPVCNLFSLDCLFDFYFDLKQDDSPAQDKGLTGDVCPHRVLGISGTRSFLGMGMSGGVGISRGDGYVHGWVPTLCYWHLVAATTHGVGKRAVCILLECFLVLIKVFKRLQNMLIKN